MRDVQKWLTIASNQIDRFRIAWVEMQNTLSKIPNGVRSGSAAEHKAWLKSQDLFFGERHFLFISLNNLFKAVEKAENQNQLSGDTISDKELKRDVTLLRHIHEHWDKETQFAAKEFQQRHPEIDPSSITFQPFEKFEVGGVELNEIQSLINRLENLFDA